MTRTALSREGAPYGAAELKETLQLYWMAGLGIAVAIHMAAIGSFYLTAGGTERSVQVRLIHDPTLRIIPPILNPTEQVSVNPTTGSKGSRPGVPVPVPPAMVDTSVELAPNINLNPAPGPDSGGPNCTWVTIPAPADAPPDTFEAVEGLPKLVRSVPPDYPDIALKSGIEGLVRVKILVDREGKPGAVSVVHSSADVLNDAAVAAAWKFRFTPGYSNSGPVPVSVEVPFRFRLADRK